MLLRSFIFTTEVCYYFFLYCYCVCPQQFTIVVNVPIPASSTSSVALSSAVSSLTHACHPILTYYPQSKLVVLRSLSDFLRHALAACRPASNDTVISIPTQYLSSSFASYSAYQSFDALLRPISLSYDSCARCWDVSSDPRESEAFLTESFVSNSILHIDSSSTLQEISESASSSHDFPGTSTDDAHDRSDFVTVSRTVAAIIPYFLRGPHHSDLRGLCIR